MPARPTRKSEGPNEKGRSDGDSTQVSGKSDISSSFTGPVVQWIVRKSPELDIQVRFLSGLLIFHVFYAYVVKSVWCEYIYKGHCHDLEKRIVQHNSGMTKSIRPYLPFELVYFEEFETELES